MFNVILVFCLVCLLMGFTRKFASRVDSDNKLADGEVSQSMVAVVKVS